MAALNKHIRHTSKHLASPPRYRKLVFSWTFIDWLIESCTALPVWKYACNGIREILPHGNRKSNWIIAECDEARYDIVVLLKINVQFDEARYDVVVLLEVNVSVRRSTIIMVLQSYSKSMF